MKHMDDKFNRIQDPDAKIPNDEPVFLLRAQDVTAATAVRIWADLQLLENPTPAGFVKCDKAREWAKEMDLWPKKKIAD
ncbi:unnamed protein product [marine sediment metagenome]|uniref:Uncharacterized protein n=1 Tax=marine sediment metagenome TaxID=412755 RepID=X0U3U5_9ZZZZ